MKQTLLEMTQDVLYSIDGDEITDINDNYESRQVARIVRECYNNIIPGTHLPETNTLFQLDVTSASSPTIMTIPTDCISFDWIKYNCIDIDDTDPVWNRMEYIPLSDFIDQMHALNPSLSTEVETFTYTVNSQTRTFNVYNDRAPTCYTTWDDFTLVFDAYDSAVETYLAQAKTMLYGKEDQTFTLSNSFIPNLDSEQFPLLVQDAISTAWIRLKQVSNGKADTEARRHKIRTQLSKHKGPAWVNAYQQMPNYGRK